MLFTFVVLFWTLGCDLAYGQGEEGNEKEEVTVTLDFSKKGAFGLKNNNANNNQSVLTDITFKVQDLSVSLRGMICYHEGENTYLRLDKWYNNPGQINISVPNSALINSVTLGTNTYGINALQPVYNGKYKTPINVNANNTTTVSSINSDNISFIENGNKDKDKSYITTITLTYTRPKLDATLDEKGENVESTISEIVGENKTLALNRTFNPSQLYTMCLPFDLSKDMITEIFGNETKVYSYDGYQNGELSFSTVKEGVLNAGMPFLMRPEYYVEQPTFADVTVRSTTAQTVGGGEWDLCGTFGSYELAADGTQLFLIADGTLAKPLADSRKMRGFRCYLKKAAGTVNGSAQLPSVTIDGETNAIKTAEYAAPTSATTRYSLSGMKLNEGCKTANGGIMIIDGKKFITTNR
ncbi:conserved domain protein [Prevotella sp. CAG:592]|nr:conserved domain protein [Prevotella sp. CAG:592]